MYNKTMHNVSVSAEDIFQALSDPLRIRMVRLLGESRNEACLCEFADVLEEPEYKLSRHLKILRQAGIISTEKDGRRIYYGLVTNIPFLKHVIAAVRSIEIDKTVYERDHLRWSRYLDKLEEDKCKIRNPGVSKKLHSAK